MTIVTPPPPTDNDGTDSDGYHTPPPTDNDGTDSDGYDTPLPTTDNDGIDTPPLDTDRDGTDSDGYDTPIPVDSRATSGIQTQTWTVRPGDTLSHIAAYLGIPLDDLKKQTANPSMIYPGKVHYYLSEQRIDTPPPFTDNDGTDSDGYDTPPPTDNDGVNTEQQPHTDNIDTPPSTPDTLPPTPESDRDDDDSDNDDSD